MQVCVSRIYIYIIIYNNIPAIHIYQIIISKPIYNIDMFYSFKWCNNLQEFAGTSEKVWGLVPVVCILFAGAIVLIAVPRFGFERSWILCFFKKCILVLDKMFENLFFFWVGG